MVKLVLEKLLLLNASHLVCLMNQEEY